jgi:hypothetical protein
MENNSTNDKSDKRLIYRRIFILLTYISLVGFVLGFEYCKIHGIDLKSETICIIFLVGFALGFYFSFIRTGLWSFIHKPASQFNQHELEITSNSLRISYSVFAIFVLSLLLAFSLAEFVIDIITVIGLLILAHSLPAAVLGWTQKRI